MTGTVAAYPIFRTPNDMIKYETTSNETGFVNMTSRPDSLAELSRMSIFMPGAVVGSEAEITDVKAPEVIGYQPA